MRIKRLTIKDVEYVAHRLAIETMSWSEPIPDFGTRFTNSLERCIETPFQSFGGRQLYKGLMPKASILFYLMIKNHPFQNGNKRIAMTTLFYFLYENLSLPLQRPYHKQLIVHRVIYTRIYSL